eukprot:Tbor_TRINITY_DN6609_c0_g1::TRINITY_DN6609_c0_g1_i1::g.3066::m.3066
MSSGEGNQHTLLAVLISLVVILIMLVVFIIVYYFFVHRYKYKINDPSTDVEGGVSVSSINNDDKLNNKHRNNFNPAAVADEALPVKNLQGRGATPTVIPSSNVPHKDFVPHGNIIG